MKRSCTWTIVFFLITSVVANNLCAAEHTLHLPGDSTAHLKRVYNSLRIKNPPVIDGKLNDSCWKLGEWQTGYTQFSPVYKGKASHKTTLKILYNDKSVFVAIRAYDDMKQITRRLSRRDQFSGDIVGVHFDSYFDHRTAFEFDLTSAGQKIDLWLSNDGWDTNWNAVWNGKVAYEDSAWTAEFEIPLSQLRFSSAETQVWGLNSWRLIDRLKEENHWNLVANDGTGLVYTFGELHGLEGFKKANRIELSPYVSAKLVTDKRIARNPFAKGSSFQNQFGLDAKIGISNNFTLNATINPDFGQVEADPSVMNLTAFETYFEEKRPFFTEGKNIFDFTFDADQLFYSRRIGHAPSYTPSFDTVSVPEFTTIGAAVKLSGKTSKGLSLGIIESLTPHELASIHDHNQDFKQVAEPFSNYFIGRFQKDYDKGNTIIGGIVTHTHRSVQNQYLQFLSNNALTYGLDFTHYWKDRTYFTEIKTIGSTINGDVTAIRRLQTSSAHYFQRPDIKGVDYDTSKTLMNGVGASVKAGKSSKGHWRYSEEFILRSPGLDLNDLGYMNLSNIIKNNNNLSYVEKVNTKVFKTYTISLLQQNAWDAHGEDLYSQASITAQTEFMNGWVAQLNSQYKFRIVDDWLLRGGPSMKVPDLLMHSWLLQTNSSKKLYVSLTGTSNKGMKGSFKSINLSAELSYRPVSNLAVSLQPTYIKTVDELQYVGQFSQSSSANKHYLLGKVDNRNAAVSFRIDWAITPEFTVQYYGSPFVSIGKYSHFKEVLHPHASVYTDRFTELQPQINGTAYGFDADADGTIDYSIGNPDFNYQQFRSNLVLRWEYKVGSVIYLVWTQDRTAFEQPGLFDINNGLNHLKDLYPRNVFMVKFNYLFRR